MADQDQDSSDSSDAGFTNGAKHCLQSLRFTLSGSLDSLSRAEAAELIEKHGGKVTAAPSKRTDFAVVGAKVASKTLELLDHLKVRKIGEQDLLKIIRKLPAGNKISDRDRIEKAAEIIVRQHRDDTSDEEVQNEDEVEDIEDDETSSEAAEVEPQSSMFQSVGKRKLPITSSSTAARKFFKMANHSRSIPPIQQSVRQPSKESIQEDSRAWTERYRPRSCDELGVNKNKTKEVEDFLSSAFTVPISPKALVLKGPSGSGKTTVVELLSEKLGIRLKHWTNPASSAFGSSDYTSFAAHFEDFIGVAGKFQGLETSVDLEKEVPDWQQQRHPEAQDRQVIVIEDFPSPSSDNALRAFRATLSGYIFSISRKNSFDNGRWHTPIVFIISESVVSNSTNSSDKFTAHRLLGPDIMNTPHVRTIDFNEVAPTFLARALKLVADRRARDIKKPPFASQQVMKKLANLKDLRQAVSTLEFLETQIKQPAVTLIDNSNRSKATSSLDLAKNAERIMLDLIEERHGNLGLFHAVGKVIYNKRGEHKNIPVEKPASEVDVDLLFTTTGTDTSTFISALHENYALSCYSSTGKSEDDIETLISCTESLCDADLLSAWAARRGGSGNATAGEDIRQDEIAFHVSVSGLLTALPWPVKRRAPTFTGSLAGSRYDPHRMYYPKDLKLWRQKDEVSSVLDSLTTRALIGTLDADLMNLLSRHSSEAQGDDSPASGPLGSGSAAKMELILDRLPYVSKLISQQQVSASMTAKDIEKVTRFRGRGIFATDEDSDEELDAEERLKNNPFSAKVTRKGKTESKEDLGVQSLVLSDDDIEDDDMDSPVKPAVSSAAQSQNLERRRVPSAAQLAARTSLAQLHRPPAAQ